MNANEKKSLAAATGVAQANLDKVIASHAGQGVTDAVRAAAGPSEWVGGLPLPANGGYTDVYEADGSLKTFATAATKDLPATDPNRKVAGRMVKDSTGKEFKLYKKFLGLVIAASAPGVERLTIDGTEYCFLKSARFGIDVSTDENGREEEYMGQKRKPLKHEAKLA